MKRFLIIIILTFLIFSNGQSVRIITNLDIANWYINSHLVMICNVFHIDTIQISRYDSIIEDNIKLKYDIIKEKYSISIDSLIKGEFEKQNNKTITTPSFRINYSKTKQSDKKFTGFDSKGDSIFEINLSLWNDEYYDDSYFRLTMGEKYLVILSRINNNYEILYASECNYEILGLIREIKSKGQSYIEDFLKAK